MSCCCFVAGNDRYVVLHISLFEPSSDDETLDTPRCEFGGAY